MAIFDHLWRIPPVERVDFAKLRVPTTPNTYLVCPVGYGLSPINRPSPVYTASPTRLLAAFESVAMADRDTWLLTRWSDQILIVQRTRWLRWPDLIQARALPMAEGRAALAVYSRSVYGSNDFGVNRARVERWLATLDQVIANSDAKNSS